MSRPGAPVFLFVANAPWLDFIATELREGAHRVELLRTFDDLVAWSRTAGLVDDATADAITREMDDPIGRTAALADALALRGELRGVANAVTSRRRLAPEGLRLVNRLLQEHPIRLALERKDGRWRVASQATKRGASVILAKIAEDAARFLAEADLSLVKHCANVGCGVAFYDTSKNHRRRWCSMQYCGNRAKAALHRARARRTKKSPTRRRRKDNPLKAHI